MKVLDLMNNNLDWEEILSNPPYSITIKRDGGYILLKYNQFLSDFSNPVVRECRGSIFSLRDDGLYECVCHAFDKFGGSLGSLGCVSFLFDRKGVLVLEKGNLSEDDVLLLALDADAEDVKDEGDVYEIVCAPENLTNVKSKLEESGLNFISSEVEFIPQNYVDLDEKQCDTFQKMVDKLEESDDVQEVIHNVNLDDEE